APERLRKSRSALVIGYAGALHGSFHHPADSHTGSELGNLRYATHARSLTHRHVAAVRLHPSIEHFKQRGFAGAVRSNDADAVAFRDGERNILEKWRAAVSL